MLRNFTAPSGARFEKGKTYEVVAAGLFHATLIHPESGEHQTFTGNECTVEAETK